MLVTQDLRQVQENLKEALVVEKVNLDRLREKVRQLQVVELGYRQCYAVAVAPQDIVPPIMCLNGIGTIRTSFRK
jgi:hypothetical protein